MKLFGNLFGLTDKLVHIFFCDISYFISDIELSSKFTRRPFSDMEKPSVVFFAVSFGSLCYVACNRYSRACHLVFQAEVAAIAQNFIETNRKAAGAFPDLEIFE